MNILRRLIAWARQVNWQTEPAVIMGVIKGVVAALAGAGLTISDHMVAAISLYVTAGCLVLASFITRAKVTSPATAANLKLRLTAANARASLAAKTTADDPAINDLITKLQETRIRMNPAGDHPQFKLGRHVNHDPRSRQYALTEAPAGTAFKAVRWARRAPVFDQGQLGSCTGNAGAGWIGTDDSLRQGLTKLADGTTVDETLAVAIYSAATQIDSEKGEYPPTDTGSDGLAVAKVLKARGLAVDYLHAFSAQAAYTALQSGPGMAGTVWYQSMFTTDADGHIQVDKNSGVAGGHEYVIDQLEVDGSGAPTKVWMQNSWGTGWGVGGRGWFTPAEFAGLLAAQGDFTQPTAVVPAPAPTPPVPPSPAPGPDAGFQVAPDLLPHMATAAKRAGLSEDAWLNDMLHKHFKMSG